MVGHTSQPRAFGTAPCVRTPWGIPCRLPSPQAQNIVGPMPHVFLADEAFPLRRTSCARTQATTLGRRMFFNFRLSHVRRMVECAFAF
ncbi:hypothetical protein N1851_003969 [Merluccius polli]|uniref:DDE Tnp4 domain-containing protein n=1 Tax=Merluccius polli TaxID=89951 RepID=A0AA47N8N8_MERPO|nr:hypothetical protein N1851_003969 [Merluccius polli]